MKAKLKFSFFWFEWWWKLFDIKYKRNYLGRSDLNKISKVKNYVKNVVKHLNAEDFATFGMQYEKIIYNKYKYYINLYNICNCIL